MLSSLLKRKAETGRHALIEIRSPRKIRGGMFTAVKREGAEI